MFCNALKAMEKKRHKLYAKGQYNALLEPLFMKPMVDYHKDLRELKIMAFDFETTGLCLEQDVILSMAAINLDGLQINFAKAFHHYIKRPLVNNNEVMINHIRQEDLDEGLIEEEAIKLLVQRLAEDDGILLCHCHSIEEGFLRKALKLGDKDFLPIIFLDTMILERTIYTHKNTDVSLSNLRKLYGLPPYEAHNALADSLATAELFMAQLKTIYGNKQLRLIDLYKRLY